MLFITFLAASPLQVWIAFLSLAAILLRVGVIVVLA